MKHIRLYTDGACAGNPGRGGWAAVAFDGSDNIMQRGAGYRRTTNNRMEILAVIEGLDAICRQLREQTRDTDIKITVMSDSQLVVSTMTQGWSKKTNRDLWSRLDEVIGFWGAEYEIRFEKVKGHSDNNGNNIADRVAVFHSREENATNIDHIYEGISPIKESDNEANNPDGPIFPKIIREEPEITEIRLKNVNIPELRLVEMELSNGTVVKISGYQGGFIQYDANNYEMRLTQRIAEKYTRWLNGKNL